MKPYVVITGATGAIGQEIALGLAKEGHNVVLACRNEEKATSLIAKIKEAALAVDARFLPLDLADEKSVRTAANTLKDLRISALINNAGVMNRRYRRLPSGVEMTIAVNYLHTALFTELILPHLDKGGVVVFTTSLTRFLWKRDQGKFSDHILHENPGRERHNYVPQITEKDFSQLGTYGLSKRLLTDYAGWLSQRVDAQRVRVNCADPGVVNTGMIHMDRWYDRLADLFFRPFIRTPRQGAIPALRAFNATDTGRIFTRFRKRKR